MENEYGFPEVDPVLRSCMLPGNLEVVQLVVVMVVVLVVVVVLFMVLVGAVVVGREFFFYYSFYLPKTIYKTNLKAF